MKCNTYHRNRRFTLVVIALFMTLSVVGISTIDAAAQSAVRLSAKSIKVDGRNYILHKVSRGETLYSIALAYGVSQDDVMSSNNLVKDNIRKNQTLLIPQHATPAAPATEQSGTTTDAPTPAKIAEQPRSTTTTKQPAAEHPTVAQTPVTAPAPATSSSSTSTPTDEDADSKDAVNNTSTESGANTPAVSMKAFEPGDPLSVVIVLPLDGTYSKADDNFTDYYKGTLVGLNALKSSGINVNVRFISGAALDVTTANNPLASANLIIGPVYADAFAPVAAYASAQGIPIISPLGSSGAANSPFVFEASPAESYKYDKLLAMLHNDSVNAIIIDHVESSDRDIDKFLEDRLDQTKVSMLAYTSQREKTADMNTRLAAMLDKDRENVILVPVSKESAVEEVLSRISSINTLGRYRITVIGTPRWGWFGNMNLDMFFRLNVHYPTTYHADRSNVAVNNFYKEYIEAFGTVPSPYSFRGHDVIRYFSGAMNRFGTDMLKRVAEYNPEMLQVKYQFVQQDAGSKYENRNWVVVNYQPNYAIRLK